ARPHRSSSAPNASVRIASLACQMVAGRSNPGRRVIMPPVERDGASLKFRDGAAEMTLTVVSPRIVRVALGSGERDRAPSYIVDREWPVAPFDLAPGEPTRVTTGALQVEIASSPLRLTFLAPR